jgi:hypothetical protein
VSYVANDAVSGSEPVDSKRYSDGQTATVLGNAGSLALPFNSFAGWNTQAGGTGTSYAAGATVVIGGSMTLYAQWTANAWEALGSGMNNGVYALAFDSSGNLHAGGYFTTAGGTPAECVAKLEKWGPHCCVHASGLDALVHLQARAG